MSDSAGADAQLDPQSADFLTLFNAPTEPVATIAGSNVSLWKPMLVAELPDYDPLTDLGKISAVWSQTMGPAVAIRDASTPAASVTIPLLDSATTFEFRLDLRNAAGAKPLLLRIDVRPPS
jgi:hypothetical protein